MASTIKLKNGSGAPTAGDLVQGEPALDLTNKRLYTEDAGGTVVEVGTNPTALTIGGTALTATATELNVLDGVTATTAEINVLDGITATTAELNKLDGATVTTAELNVLDGITATTAELNILDGVTATTAELNKLDGLTATTAELNYTDGVTSNIQTQLNTKAPIASPTFTGTTTIPTADINGGTIDGTVIGGTTAAAGTFTTGQFDTSVNVDGTVTANGLTVDGDVICGAAGDTSTLSIKKRFDGTGSLNFIRTTAGFPIDANITCDAVENLIISWSNDVANKDLLFQTQDTTHLKIQDNGDISFYEDTGTTPKLFWDASAERLGIGTSSPATKLDVAGVTPTLTIKDTQNKSWTGSDTTLGELAFRTSDSSGIGAHNVAFVRATNDVASATTPSGALSFGVSLSNNNASEAMRIDSSGTVSVGTIDSNVVNNSGDTPGINLGAGGNKGSLAAARYEAAPLSVNRLGNDGDIATFRRDSTTVGSIGYTASGLYIDGEASHTGIQFAGDTWLPRDNGSAVDDVVDLGVLSRRFNDIYATNGTIQTSDRNEKQDIEELSEAEQRVAVAAKGLLRKFRWKSAVEEKGDDARIHFGIIAQDLQAAFEAEGLDAGRYAMFIHSTWTDEETGEERSRMGVRYSELLAFIIAAI